MIDIVFISDIHLHPEDQMIQARFNAFIEWAKKSVKTVYILGDLFHLWVGDDDLEPWSEEIAKKINRLTQAGVTVFYLHGNRDFLLGKRFAKLAGWTVLHEPVLIQLAEEPILLVHGDSYCTKDLGHQRLRKLTRNKLFSTIFLSLPLKFRKKLANRLREQSMNGITKTTEEMDVVAESVIKQMQEFNVKTLIHGHTHKPGLTKYQVKDATLKRYVLSDWDDTPQILCYNESMGLYFDQI
ncbi:MAG: UDP-2,3-diacylglucosamine diphosphatase [Legionella sp.]|nr:MAG: UDP-2,3-diacylglucosamine diphosphatase [Legionella sp.]